MGTSNFEKYWKRIFSSPVVILGHDTSPAHRGHRSSGIVKSSDAEHGSD